MFMVETNVYVEYDLAFCHVVGIWTFQGDTNSPHVNELHVIGCHSYITLRKCFNLKSAKTYTIKQISDGTCGWKVPMMFTLNQLKNKSIHTLLFSRQNYRLCTLSWESTICRIYNILLEFVAYRVFVSSHFLTPKF